MKNLSNVVKNLEDPAGRVHEVLRMQDAMGPGSECLASVRAAARWLHEQAPKPKETIGIMK